MTLKNVYFVQANSVVCGETSKSVYLPYATGCIAAYAFDDEKICAEYKFGGFIYTRMNLDKALEKLKNPYIASFSCTTWNTEYNKALAKKVREKYPDCIIIFGGHNVPTGEKMLEICPYVDYLIHGEGEIVFKQLLEAFLGERKIEAISNISYRDGEKLVSTQKEFYSFFDFPSPYTSGIFDSILHDGYDFAAIFETNRGCPNQCAFCDWGKLRSKVRMFSWDRVKAELEWFGANGIEYIYGADANFGLFSRDIDITKEMIRVRNETGCPKKFKVNFSKNKQEQVMEVSRLISHSGLGKAQTLSFQSLNPQVLKNIGRSNLDINYFNRLISFCNEENIQTYTELILGLPGETKESFTDGINTLLVGGQHKTLNVYPCELLPNSIMGSSEYIEQFGLKTVDVPFILYHSREDEDDAGVVEYAKTMCTMDSMDKEGFIYSYLFAVTVQAMHMLGLTRFISIYLFKEKNISYKSFYSSLIDYAEKTDGVLHTAFKSISDHIREIYDGKAPLGECDLRFGTITYEMDDLLFLRCIYHYDELFNELTDFVTELTGKEADEEMQELLKYQKAVIYHPERPVETVKSEYDFTTYFRQFLYGEPVELEKCTSELTISNSKPISWDNFARNILWYGRHDELSVYLADAYHPQLKNM